MSASDWLGDAAKRRRPGRRSLGPVLQHVAARGLRADAEQALAQGSRTVAMDGLDKLPRGGARVAQLAATQRALAARQPRRQLESPLVPAAGAGVAREHRGDGSTATPGRGPDGVFVSDVAVADFAGALRRSASLGRR